MERVYIEWEDAYEGTPGWQSLESAINDTKKPMICKTVGYVVSENEDSIVITSTQNEECVMSPLHIPLGMIRKIKRYK